MTIHYTTCKQCKAAFKWGDYFDSDEPTFCGACDAEQLRYNL